MQVNEETLLKNLGQHIHKLRKSKKLTLGQVCYGRGIEPSTLSRIEQAVVEPKYITLVKIASAFNISVSELLNF